MGLGPKEMGEAIIRNLQEKTGKSIDEWLIIVSKTNLDQRKEIMAYLKQEKSLGHFQAQKIYEFWKGADAYNKPSSLIDELFNTKNSIVLYKQISSKIFSLGKGVDCKPCKTYVPFYHNRQFALLSKTRGDSVLIGLNLPEYHGFEGLQKGCSKGSRRINHSITLKSISDLNQEVQKAIDLSYKNN